MTDDANAKATKARAEAAALAAMAGGSALFVLVLYALRHGRDVSDLAVAAALMVVSVKWALDAHRPHPRWRWLLALLPAIALVGCTLLMMELGLDWSTALAPAAALVGLVSYAFFRKYRPTEVDHG